MLDHRLTTTPLIRGLGGIAGNFKGGVTDFVALIFAAFRPVDQIGRIRRWIEILPRRIDGINRIMGQGPVWSNY